MLHSRDHSEFDCSPLIKRSKANPILLVGLGLSHSLVALPTEPGGLCRYNRVLQTEAVHYKALERCKVLLISLIFLVQLVVDVS